MVPSIPLDGDPVPADGGLPDQAFIGIADRPLAFYVHVPFCATRCGYCDFNTYTAAELGLPGVGPRPTPATGSAADTWLAAAIAEIDLAATVLANGPARPVSTVFIGGGTPSLIGAEPLNRVLDHIRSTFGLTPDAEVTTEANPESTDISLLSALRGGGFTRLSLGMQSAIPHVLEVLDRTHTPGRALEIVAAAREVGFDHINLDLIYGTPGEQDSDFATSLRVAVDSGVDHISAYSLIVEPGTRMARQVKSGLLPMPQEDVLADRYLLADQILTDSGMSWYEVSNWATNPAAQCRHNLGYWSGGDWWGVGPGAHSHVGGVRWWNVRHPAKYAAVLAQGQSPGQAREVLDDEARRTEDILLRLRLKVGLPLTVLRAEGLRQARNAVADGLLDPEGFHSGTAVLTSKGRLLADGLAIRLLD